MRHVLIGAIILNWNRSNDTIRAVRSLERLASPQVIIVVVDNGSDPNDLANLREHCSSATIVANGVNHGFARAVNIGARAAFEAGVDHLLLLNNDAYFAADVPALQRCIDALEADPALGAVGPTIVNDDPSRTIQSAGLIFSTAFPVPIGIARGAPYDPTILHRTPSYLMGSCLLVRGESFAEVGGMDADYFFFGEDIQLAFDLNRIGKHERLLADTYVVHRKSSSIREGSWRYAYLALRANLLVLQKNARCWEWPLAFFTMILVSLALCVRSATSWGGPGPAPILRAWRHFFERKLGDFNGTWPTGYEQIDFPDLWRRTRGTKQLNVNE